MRMAGTEGMGSRGVTSEWAPVAREPIQRVWDALESSYLDDSRSDELFERLMARLAVEERRKRKRNRWFGWIGMAVGLLAVGAGAVHWLS